MTKIKRTGKQWPKVIRNIIRINRLNRYGWGCFGMILCTRERADFWVKRSNWVYNFINHGVMFKGVKA